MRKLLIAGALALAAAALLAACGDGNDEGAHTITATGNGTDRAFVAEMVPHHESAIEMAKVAQERGQSEFVSSLADDIVRTQNEEIDEMEDFDADLEASGVKAGDLGLSDSMMGMEGDMSSLMHADAFDEMFMRMMVPHHQGAIRMARIELRDGENAQLKVLAQGIIDAQSKEIAEMNQQLTGSGAEGSGMHHSGAMGSMNGM
jgi:uncharacterized protein (DUF305 family)